MAHAEGSKTARWAVNGADTESRPDAQSAAPTVAAAAEQLLPFLLIEHPLPDQTSSQGYIHKHQPQTQKMCIKMLIVCADFICSATERCASECFISCRPGLIILSFNDRRRADPHSVGRCGCRYSQVHKQGRLHSSLQPWKRKMYQDCGRFMTIFSLDLYRMFKMFFCADHGDDQRDNDGNLQRPFQEHNGKHNCRGKFSSVCSRSSSFHTDYLTSALLMPQIRRLRIEIEKLQWLHQQELSEMKHNLGRFTESQIP